MTVPETTAANAQYARDRLRAARDYFNGRHGALALTVIGSLVGLGFGWNWLVAAGIAPILLAVLPCVAMCGLGLCMNKLTGNACATKPSSPTTVEPTKSEARTDHLENDLRVD